MEITFTVDMRKHPPISCTTQLFTHSLIKKCFNCNNILVAFESIWAEHLYMAVHGRISNLTTI